MTNTAPFLSLLSKIVDNRGRTCPTAESGLPLIATNCVKNSTLYPVFEKVRYVDQQTYSTWFRGHPLPGDLIFVCKGSPGQVCMTPDPVNFCIAQDMVAVRADPKKVYPPYLFTALRSDEMQSAIVNMHVGTLIPHFKKGDFDKLEIPLPDEPMQKFIGDMYLSVTEKIELNRRMNETLEGMAQAIFRDWFVDFGPVRRKVGGAADPVAIMGGLTPDPARAAHLAALFPAAIGNDGLPVGWTFQPVSIFGELKGGKQLEKQHILPAGPNPVFGGAGIMGYATISNADGYVITVGRVGAYCGQFFGHRGAAWVNNNASLIKPLGTTPPEWLLLALRNSDMESIKRGAAQPFVSNGDVGKLPIVDAGPNIRTAFQEFVEPMFLLSEAKQVESATLAETRDYLLPRLMSGAVRVMPKAEAG